MEIKIPLELFKDTGVTFQGSKELIPMMGFGGSAVLSLKLFPEEELKKLKDAAKAKSKTCLSHMKGTFEEIVRSINLFSRISKNELNTKINRLDTLVTVLKEAIGGTKHKWIFLEHADGMLVPYLVTNIVYNRGYRDNPSSTQISATAVRRGEFQERNFYFHANDLVIKSPGASADAVDFEAFVSGKDMDEDSEEDVPTKAVDDSRRPTVGELLESEGINLETPELIAGYMAELKTYNLYVDYQGKQFLATGRAITNQGYWSTSSTEMVREGRPTKVVVDDTYKDDTPEDRSYGRKRKATSVVDFAFWKKGAFVPPPIHPYIQIFDLDKHQFLELHSSYLTPYAYNSSLASKLVLPKAHHQLVSMLIDSAGELMEDIISGKTGGIIIIATGPPGTGKTLTAEVYAETLEKPAYLVQCSQLGTDENDLEKHLRKVLTLASRWGAILLMDEADVYIRERGKDIHQNAIVGVFLRLLEYYRGILFMTSNRGEIIDDAILSRATAWLKYDKPDTKDLERIWKVLSKQFEIELSEPLLLELLEAFPHISGRNVKSLLKLARMQAKKRGQDYTLELFQNLALFLPLL